MVFSSVPVYLDPPNWHHQHLNQGTGGENPQHLPHLPSAAAHHHVVGGGGGGSIIWPEEGSMAADRARLGNNNKVVQPEVPLKCPRCDSTNTKFCYFNNYSLSQPRHFCKTCRRYWTRGGALRNVPVGGGCRRNNKKSKSSSSSSSKSSSANNDEKQPQIGNYNYSNSTSTLNTPSHVIGHPQQRQASAHQLPLMATLHNLSQYSNTGTHNNTGFNFVGGGNHRTDHVDFHIGSSTNSSISSSSLLGFHQFPFFEAPIRTAGLYSFQNQNNVTEDPSSSLVMAASNSRVSDEHRRQGAPVKMEDQQPQLQQQGINFTRQLLGISENQFDWGAAAGNNNWTDLSEGLDHNPSSSTIPHHLL